MSQTAFKPVFDGYFKIYLHDDDYKRAADRAEFTGQWIRSKLITADKAAAVRLV